MHIQMAITELHSMFRKINALKFSGELPEPAILIQNQGKRKGVLGWCTREKIWTDKDGTIKKYEISMCAEHLARPVLDLACTMIHEMVHLYNNVQGIKDTSRGVYWHNEVFKNAAERVGLIVTKSAKYGWAYTELSPELQAEFEKLGFNQDAFVIERKAGDGKGNGEGKAANKSLKYSCPECKCSVRATKQVNIACLDCRVTMVAEDIEGAKEDEEEKDDDDQG